MGYRISYQKSEEKERKDRLWPMILLLLALLYRLVLAPDHQAGLFSKIENAFASLDSLVFHLRENEVYSAWEGVFRYAYGSDSRLLE